MLAIIRPQLCHVTFTTDSKQDSSRPEPVDFQLILSVWVVQSLEWNPRVWLAVMKIKQNFALHQSDKDHLAECF